MFAKISLSNENLIKGMIEDPQRHILADMECRLAGILRSEGFIEVKTPLIISKASLEKMTITKDSQLFKQVFSIDEKRCLRPMLAPELYFVMRKLRDRTKGPVRIFEIGSCFRKESRSTNHLEEFTMLNFVELGPVADPMERLKELISKIMEGVGLEYDTVTEGSEVYRTTMDVEVNGRELASGAVGPHVLDPAHDIHEPWCGAGFGLERILMEKMGRDNIKKSAKSLVYLNGAKID